MSEPGKPAPGAGARPREDLTADLEGAVGVLSDVPLCIEVELDRKYSTVKEILNLQVGQIVRMNRSAGENIDIRIGGSLIGYGEIVVLEEKIGVRITDFHEEV